MIAMRWTEQDLERYRQCDAQPSQDDGRGRLPVNRRELRMNKTEIQYGQLLELRLRAGEILEYAFEDTTLVLADRARYTPDFRVITIDQRTEFHEVKGYWREDARLKIKFAARSFKYYRFIAVRRLRKSIGGGWAEEAF